MLFADTFNNFYHPDTAIAAVEVLEDAGFRVDVPMADLCCGRPLYDYGFLGMARRWWEHMLRELQPQIEAGMPMVVLEPSCWAAFKDELTNIVAQNEDAKRLQDQTYTLADFLEKRAPHYRPPKLHGKALLHGHCHQKALDRLNDKQYGKMFNEKKVLSQMGVDHREPETGCCGMAGAFGFEAENGHRDISVKCGERVLLPETRKAGDDEIIIADGFSCREQIEQCTDRRAMHIAQVMAMALHGQRERQDGERPEAAMVRRKQREFRRAAGRTAGFVAAGAVVGALAWRALRRSREPV
jgi:Fe-S oxidoreductase